ncbi:MAG: M1 family aminopeptidase, partial [Gemmatimonadota bacterium]
VDLRVPADPHAPIPGEVTVRARKSGEGPLILDFADPSRIESVQVGGRAVEWSAAHNHVVVPARALPEGAVSVRLTFFAGDAPLNRRDGFFYSLFVPDRAHETLPVFDQPDLKARYSLRLTVPHEWVAVANGAVERREERADGVAYTFRETEPISTYLFAFAAGEFLVEEAERDGRRLRMIHRETDAEKVARNRDAIFDLHATALAWLEEYTGIDYPFGKFDFVAVPSFQYGGMEHPGSILYRASTLFLDESATRSQELARASLIAHETAHMWFGNLVTMGWFSDVWMKEVFANFMAAKIVNPSFPDLDHELRFLLAHYPAAYGVDRTAGANPVRQPLENLADAGTLYGAIIYQKAPIVMRHLEQLVGETAMREAVRSYLDGNRFGNAGWPVLVEELDRVTPLDVAAWSRVWIEEPGRPTIEVTRSGDGVVLTPRDPAGRGRVWPQTMRAAFLADGVPTGADRGADRPADRAGRADRARAGGWSVIGEKDLTIGGEPVAVRAPEPLRDDGGLDEAVVLPNAAGLAYGYLRLDPASRDRLLAALHDLPEPVLRAAAWLDLWEMMLAGEVEPAALLELGTRVVAEEPDELVAQQVLDDLGDLFWRYLPETTREAAGPRLENVLWSRLEAVEGTSRKAAYFHAWRSVAITPAAVSRMQAVWAEELEVEGLPLSERDRTTLALHLAVRGAADAEAILDAQEAAIENPDRRERFAFVRRAVAADPAERDRFFASLAERENRSREEWVVTGLSLLHHPLRAERSVRYVRPSLDLLLEVKETGDIFFPTRWLAATLGGHSSPEAAAIVRRFMAEHPDYPPRLMGKLLQEADPLFRAVELRSDS